MGVLFFSACISYAADSAKLHQLYFKSKAFLANENIVAVELKEDKSDFEIQLNDMLSSNIILANSNPTLAKLKNDSVGQLAKKQGYTQGYIQSIINNVYITLKKGKYVEALKQLDEVDHVAEKNGFLVLNCRILSTQSMGLSHIGSFESALDLGYAALKIAEKQEDNSLMQLSYNRLSYVYSMMGQVERALEFSSQSLEFGLKGTNKRAVNNDMADIASQIARLDVTNLYPVGRLYLASSTKFDLDRGDSAGYGHDNFYLAQIEERLGNIGPALIANQKAIQTLTNLNITRATALAILQRARIGKNIFSNNKTKQLLEKALQDLRRLGEVKGESEACFELSELFQKMGDSDSALFYLKTHNQLEKSLKAMETDRRIAKKELQKEWDSYLQDKNRLDKKSKMLTMIFAVAFGLLLLVLVIYTLRYRKRERTLKLAFDQIKAKESIQLVTKSNSSSTNTLDQNIVVQVLNSLKVWESELGYLNQEANQQTLAKELNTNRHYLRNIIQNQFGKSVPGYINAQRTNYLIKQLKESNWSNFKVEFIAKKLGYGSKSTMNKFFKEQTGKTVTEFIKQLPA